MPYISAETVVRDYLDAAFPAARVCTETPDNLADVLPCIRVEQIGGTDGVVSFNNAVVDVDVFAATRSEARDLAESVRASLIFSAIGQTVAGAVIADASTLAAPAKTPWDNTSLRRFAATFAVTTHNNPN